MAHVVILCTHRFSREVLDSFESFRARRTVLDVPYAGKASIGQLYVHLLNPKLREAGLQQLSPSDVAHVSHHIGGCLVDVRQVLDAALRGMDVRNTASRLVADDFSQAFETLFKLAESAAMAKVVGDKKGRKERLEKCLRLWELMHLLAEHGFVSKAFLLRGPFRDRFSELYEWEAAGLIYTSDGYNTPNVVLS